MTNKYRLTDRRVAEILARAEICDDSVLTDYADIAAAMREIQEYRKSSPAQRDVIAERQRQIGAEGWTPERDDSYRSGELVLAACCYAEYSGVRGVGDSPVKWPWGDEWWKPQGKRRNLVKAAALLLAEIERLDRREKADNDQ
ncbi:hypothetical protein ACG0Z5_10855 [Scandinavium sp. M-37]|uniref:hypothetical protein n=1 Tax=Scandinavium sp. M-37 TaxID=3373077 RepID=UPI003744D7A2